MRITAAVVLLLALVNSASGQSTEYNGVLARGRSASSVDQVIVQWRSAATPVATKLSDVSRTAGLKLERKSSIAPRMDVLKLERSLTTAELQELLATLNADPLVEYAVADERRYAHAAPADPLLIEQWYFLSAQSSATRAESAWDITTGSNATIVAVLDTGVRFEHPDLGRVGQGGKLLPGFDFVSSPPHANDGDGRDADPSDPGDYVTAQEATQPPFNGNCIEPGRNHVDSSWHGTRVSSLIGALTSNAEGMSGSGWNTLLLPVRVLGKCGGSDSDILAAMRWAAGLPVAGAPDNSAAPAKIINLSLGAEGVCTAAYQSAIAEITSRGVLIVASVGNEGGPVGSPANCPGVLGVVGLRHAGSKVGFSSLGPEASLGAPGGNCVNTAPGAPCQFSIIVATNTGLTSPAASTYTNQFNFNVGTSFSAPLVAGAAALMHAVNGNLAPADYITLLRESASAFATSSSTTTTVCRVPANAADIQNQECLCTTQTCGAGMLNTHAAVLAAQRPFAVMQAPTSIATAVDVNIDGRGSFVSNGRAISTFLWSVANVEGGDAGDRSAVAVRDDSPGARRQSVPAATDRDGRSGRPGHC